MSAPANTFLVLELETWPIRLKVPFSTTVVIDADLNQNDKGYRRLSDVLTKHSVPSRSRAI